jgi:hypothetical protein
MTNFGKHSSVVILQSLTKFGAKTSVNSNKFKICNKKELVKITICNLFSARNVIYQNQTFIRKRKICNNLGSYLFCLKIIHFNLLNIN